MDERALRELQALAAQDRELGQHAARLRELDGAIGAIRARAEAIAALLGSAAEQQALRASALADAQAGLDRRIAGLVAAQNELAAARDEDAAADAGRAVARAEDHVAVARAKAERAQALLDELERDLAAAPAEVATLGRRAAGAGATVGVPVAGGDAAALVEWASHAHAELFVATSQLDGRRERLIREVNELASMVLGEPTYGSTPAQALARVEAST